MDTFNRISSALNIETIVNQLSDLGPKILAGLVVFGLFWVLSSILHRILKSIFKHQDLDRDIEELIEQGVRITVMLVGIITGLGTAGINIGAMVASLGLVGFAVGFALKDAISNFLSGVLILVYHPFRRGDAITVGTHSGLVVNIDLRYTKLDTVNEIILVPNAFLFNNVVKVAKAQEENTQEISQ